MAAIATANVDLPLAGCSFQQIGSAQLVEIPEELALRPCQPTLSAPAPASPNCLIALERAPKAELGKLLSPTQVRAFLNCSARWWFKYGLSEPEPKNSALALGSAVHRALEANFREKVTTKEDLDTLGVVALFRSEWHDQTDQTEFRDDEDPATLGKVGEQLVAKYMDEAAPWIQPAAVELDVAGEIGGVRVRGKVDLLDEEGRVVDVKTAARKPSGIAPDYAFQLATYRQITPGASGEARLDTLVKTKTVQLIQQGYTVGEQDLRATEVLYPLVQEGIANGLYFPNRQSLTCSRRNCAFWRQCEREFGGTIAAS
jgi:CRISPR/Cas system-associated exonuclease Cas4 (RecB family)